MDWLSTENKAEMEPTEEKSSSSSSAAVETST